MRFGYQTILYGRHHRDWDDRLDGTPGTLSMLSDAGFEGVEIFQPPAVVAPTITSLLLLLERHKLELIGLSGGPIRERWEFLTLNHKDRCFLYSERLDDEAKEALRLGFRVALHPHVFKETHRLDDVCKAFEQYLGPNSENLLFLPDTAHLTIVGDDPVEAVQKFHDRLAGVHIKDWDSSYGRASHRYSKGFTELGAGDVRVAETLDELAKRGYPHDLWVIVEQDYTVDTPDGCVQRSTRYLQSRGKLLNAKLVNVPRPRPKPSRQPSDYQREIVLLDAIERFRRVDDGKALDRVLEAVCHASDPPYFAAALQSYNEEDGRLLTIAGHPSPQASWLAQPPRRDPSVGERLLSLEQPLKDRVPSQTSQSAATLGPWEGGLKGCDRTRVGIFNTFNSNQLRYILYLYAAHGQKTHTMPARRVARILGRYIDDVLDDRRERFSGRVAQLERRALPSFDTLDEHTLETYAEGLQELIRKAVACDAVALLLLEQNGVVMSPVGRSDSLIWRPDLKQISQQVYRNDDGTRTAYCWKRKLPVFQDDSDIFGDKYKVKSFVALPIDGRAPSYEEASLLGCYVLHMPMLDADGKCVGIARCANRALEDSLGTDQPRRPFSADDVAVIDGILHAAIPRLRSFYEEKERRDQLRRASHELKKPLTAIRGALSLIDKELPRVGAEESWARTWVSDAASWCDLWERIVMNPEYLRSDIEPIVEKVDLYPDVVAPIVRMMGEWMERQTPRIPYHLPNGGYTIEYGGLSGFPRDLWLDRSMWQQIIFNLVDNGLKYRKVWDPQSFHVRFQWRATSHGAVELIVRDDGIGFDPLDIDTEVAFEAATRGRRAHLYQRGGSGYGLWIVRRLLAVHHCTISITHRRDPTEFTITIPASKLKLRSWID